MASKRRLPPDLATLKRSRAAFKGAITKMKDKLNGIKATGIVTYNTKNIDRLITSISNTEAGFLQTMEDAQEFLTDGETDALQLEEDDALEAFSAAVLEVQDLADELLNLKSIRVGLDDLNCDVQALRDTFNVQPELNQDSAIQALDATYSSLRKEWKKANLPNAHPLKTELDTFSKILNQISADVATSKARSAPPPPVLSSSFSSREVDYDDDCRQSCSGALLLAHDISNLQHTTEGKGHSAQDTHAYR